MRFAISFIPLLGLILAAPCSNAESPSLPTEELNSRLPKWVRFSGEERLRFEDFAGQGFRPDAQDGYLLQRFRFGLNVTPTTWLNIFVQTQDARVFWKSQQPYAPPFQDTWDLRQAYAEIGSREHSPVVLRVGRQELAYGEERLIGPGPWANTTRTFDAARAMFHYRKLRLDVFAASVVSLHDGEIGSVVPGDNIHGMYGEWKDLVPNSVIEPFVFWRLQPRMKSEAGILANSDMKIPGIRWAGNVRALDYSTEMAVERGRLAADSISAWAGHWLIGYTIPRKGRPVRVYEEFNYASGDSNAHDGVRGTFDQLYPSAHDKLGFTDLFGWRNIEHWRSAIEVHPAKKLVASLRWNEYWLADPHDALYSLTGVIAQRADGSGGKRVGREIDLVSVYAVSKYTQVGAGWGYFIPGTFLINTTPGHSYSLPYMFVQTQF